MTARVRTRFLLTGVAGSVNAIGFTLLAGVFITGATGNVVHAGDALGGADWAVAVTFATPVVAFVVLCTTALVAARRLRSAGRDPLWALGAAEVVLLGAFLAIGLGTDASRVPSTPDARFLGLCTLAVGAMACQYAVVHTAVDRRVTTVFVAVHLVLAARSLSGVDRPDDTPAGPTERRDALVHLGMAGAFFTGGALTIALQGVAGDWAPLLPVVVLVAVLGALHVGHPAVVARPDAGPGDPAAP